MGTLLYISNSGPWVAVWVNRALPRHSSLSRVMIKNPTWGLS